MATSNLRRWSLPKSRGRLVGSWRGGDAPTEYPSGDLLAHARAALSELSKQLGAFTRGQSASPLIVRNKLEELMAICHRGEVAIAIEEAAHQHASEDEDEEHENDRAQWGGV